MTIRVGIIGASFARAAYLPALRTIDDVKVLAIASARLISAQSAADQFDIPHVYDDWGACSASANSTWSASPRRPSSTRR